MYCYDCLTEGRTEHAVGVCTSCGAGICRSCVRLESHEHMTAANPGNPHHEITRTLTCRTCDAVLKPQVSLSRASASS